MKSQSSASYNSACTVSVSLGCDTGEKLDGSCSGILIDAKQGLVLTHASLLYPLAHKLQPGKLQALRQTGSINDPFFDEKIIIDVVLPNKTENVILQKKNETDVRIYPSLLNGRSNSVQHFSKLKASLKMIFECRNLRKTIEQTLPSESWQFVDETNSVASEKDEVQPNKNINNEDINFYLLPSFLLIQLKDYTPSSQKLSIRSARANRQGDPVEICATPFGGLSPEVFLNSRSCGIISNLAGPHGVLIMTDARCVPGSEGGALFHFKNGQRKLTGIMIASLCWKNSEWVGLSMACAVSELMGSLDGYITLEEEEQIPLYTIGLGSSFVETLSRMLVYVHVGHNWGSAVRVDPVQGIYLTCSHVLAGVDTHGVRIMSHLDKTSHVCDVVYRVPQNAQFDLAVLRVRGNKGTVQQSEQLIFGKTQEGDVVYVIGHAIFKSDHDLPPTVTRGTVSKILRHNNIPVMIQTTCAVHAGVSGGGVFNQYGQLVAIVVCNSKDTSSGACYPHVNMCVPIETIASVIKQYLQNQDSSVLESLHIKNKQLKLLWSIGNEGTSGLLERVPSAGPGIRNKHKGAPARIHPNSSPIYKTQSESALTTGFRNLSVKDDKTIPKRSTSSRSGSNGVKCLADAAALLQSESVKNVVLVAGAGISTPSGIPDFRSPGTGLYDNLQQYQIPYPEAIFDIEYFHMNPRPFFTLAKELYPSGKYRPNYIHYFARLLHDKGLLLRMYTQNIDGLERLAGLPAEKLVEAHGTFATATCTICQQKLPGSDIKEKIYADKLPRCPSRGCVGIVKPDIVFFGEDLPRKFYSYMKDMLQTDMVIVMGTSLEVQPFAGIIDTVRWTVPRVLFNREAVGPFKYSRRAQDVVSPGDLIDNMVKFSTMTGWKEDMVELITKEEGEFKIINNPPPPPPKNPNQRRNYSNIANRPRAVFYSDDSSTEESTDSESDVTSSDSSDEEVNRIRKFKGVNRPKFGNNSVKNGANNSIIRNGFRSSSAKIGDRNSRNIHTDSTGTSKPSPTINGSLTGRSVKSDSGLNKYDGKRRVDRNTSNGAQNESIGNKNISVTEKNKVLRKYGLSPGPNGGQNGSNLLQDMQKPVRKNLKNSRIDIENRKPKVGFVQKRTVETEITDKSLVQPVSDNAIKNEIIDKEVIDKEGLMKTPSSVGSPKVEALNILEPGENIDNANGDTIDGKSSKIEMGIRREAPIFGLNKEQSIVSGDFTDDNAAQTLVNKGKDSSIDKSSEVPKSESKTSVISQGTSESEVDIDCIENTALNRKEDRSPKQQFDNDLFDRRDAYSVSEISNEKTSKDLSRRAAKSFAKYANLQSQRRVAGHGKPHRKSVKDKPPTGKKIPKPSSELSKLNTRPYGYAYRQRGQVKGVGPFHRMNVRTLSSSIDFTQETRAGSAELPKISYRHNVQAVKTVDRTVYGASPACEYHID